MSTNPCRLAPAGPGQETKERKKGSGDGPRLCQALPRLLRSRCVNITSAIPSHFDWNKEQCALVGQRTEIPFIPI